MKIYSYQGPFSKSSTAQLTIMDSNNIKVGFVERYFTSIFHRLIDMWVGENKFLSQHRASNAEGEIIIEAHKKNYLMKGSEFQIRFMNGHYKGQDLLVQQKGIDIFNQSYEIWGKDLKISTKKEAFDWVKFYENNSEIARWKISIKDKFKAQVQVEEKASIQDPLFYAIVGQMLYFVGD